MMLALKLVLAPSLVALASLAGRRWGDRIAGWTAGFPIVAGPVLLFFALEQGESFASQAALGTMTGQVSLAAFCLTYNWTALKVPWPASLLSGWAAFGLATWGLKGALFPWPIALLTAFASLSIAIALLPELKLPKKTATPPKWDIPARMAATAAMVLAITGLAHILGPSLSGLLTPFPVATSVLAVFAHHTQGAGAVEKVLKGLLTALYSFAVFCAIVHLALVPLGIAPAFLLGLAASVGIQLFVLRMMGNNRS